MMRLTLMLIRFTVGSSMNSRPTPASSSVSFQPCARGSRLSPTNGASRANESNFVSNGATIVLNRFGSSNSMCAQPRVELLANARQRVRASSPARSPGSRRSARACTHPSSPSSAAPRCRRTARTARATRRGRRRRRGSAGRRLRASGRRAGASPKKRPLRRLVDHRDERRVLHVGGRVRRAFEEREVEDLPELAVGALQRRRDLLAVQIRLHVGAAARRSTAVRRPSRPARVLVEQLVARLAASSRRASPNIAAR